MVWHSKQARASRTTPRESRVTRRRVVLADRNGKDSIGRRNCPVQVTGPPAQPPPKPRRTLAPPNAISCSCLRADETENTAMHTTGKIAQRTRRIPHLAYLRQNQRFIQHQDTHAQGIWTLPTGSRRRWSSVDRLGVVQPLVSSFGLDGCAPQPEAPARGSPATRLRFALRSGILAAMPAACAPFRLRPVTHRRFNLERPENISPIA